MPSSSSFMFISSWTATSSGAWSWTCWRYCHNGEMGEDLLGGSRGGGDGGGGRWRWGMDLEDKLGDFKILLASCNDSFCSPPQPGRGRHVFWAILGGCRKTPQRHIFRDGGSI